MSRDMRGEPWHPTGPQEKAALALADQSVGAHVRSHGDGTVEVRTVYKGAFRRYLIQENGLARLVESRPRTWRYAWSIGVGWLGILVAFGAVLPRIVWTFDDAWSALQVFVGIVTFVAGMCLTPYGKPPRGERWTVIGGAEE